MFFFKSLNMETGSSTCFLLSLFSIEFYFFLLAQLEDEMLVNQLILQEGYLSLVEIAIDNFKLTPSYLGGEKVQRCVSQS